MYTISLKQLSSLEKVFIDNEPAGVEVFKSSALKGEEFSYQIAFSKKTNGEWAPKSEFKIEVISDLADYITVRKIMNIPSELSVFEAVCDDGYYSKNAGLFPDALIPLEGNRVYSVPNKWQSVWVSVNIPENVKPGTYDITIVFSENDITEKVSFELEIIDICLEKHDMIFTQWFHSDCIADVHNVRIFSEEHWDLIEKYVKVASHNGMNMILTPIFTPPLDTEVGGERPTVQLVDIAIDNGKYTFNYDKLDRWVDMCHRCGIKYFELPPFFTQWGAEHAPKIVATVDGEFKRIYGWDTDAASEEYAEFTVIFVAALIDHLKKLGIDKQCYFHMSDEPKLKNLEQYKKSQAGIRKCIEGYHTMDAISNYEFYLEGLIDTPVPATNHIAPFLEGNIPGMWCYYCCSQCVDVSNRFFAMPGARTRSLGMQLFKFNIGGFLQWGYNFYYNQRSRDLINPYIETTGEDWVESGDAFVVYPGFDGKALESIRLVAFHEAIQDLRAMKLCESLYGHDAVVEAVEKVCGEVRFDKCLTASEDMLAVRERINDMIEAKI
jgi:hypothetical protein